MLGLLLLASYRYPEESWSDISAHPLCVGTLIP
jgi:hypothetical protein